MAEAGLDILITGGAGQVGLELLAADWGQGVRLHAPTRAEVDLTDAEALRELFARQRFDAVINSAAYTAVDKAEGEVAAAFQANALVPAVLADLTRATGAPLIQVSTDYVFDGSKMGAYVEDDPVAPLGVYGASKLAGELATRSGNSRSVVLRTAWVLSPHRSNFLKTMLRLAADRPALRVVEDQRGCPTSAADIAQAIKTITLRMIGDPQAPTGTYHFVNAGQASWAELAREVFAISAASGGPSASVEGIATAEYPTPARRPANSVLATDRLQQDYGVRSRGWREAVAGIMAQLNDKETAR
jgi:dTDP-4-dehydrorhamnose reductase